MLKKTFIIIFSICLLAACGGEKSSGLIDYSKLVEDYKHIDIPELDLWAETYLAPVSKNHADGFIYGAKKVCHDQVAQEVSKTELESKIKNSKAALKEAAEANIESIISFVQETGLLKRAEAFTAASVDSFLKNEHQKFTEKTALNTSSLVFNAVIVSMDGFNKMKNKGFFEDTNESEEKEALLSFIELERASQHYILKQWETKLTELSLSMI